jgi:hypothetical protein
MLPPAKISGTTLERTIIAEGSIINASRLEGCVVGIRSRIGHGTTVVNTYIMGNDFYETLEVMQENISQGIPEIGIGERCYIKDAIIDKNCRTSGKYGPCPVHGKRWNYRGEKRSSFAQWFCHLIFFENILLPGCLFILL